MVEGHPSQVRILGIEQVDPTPVPRSRSAGRRPELDRVPLSLQHQIAEHQDLAAQRIEAASTHVGAAGEADFRATGDGQRSPRLNHDIAVDLDLAGPGRVGTNVTLQRLPHQDVDHHVATLSPDALQSDAHRQVAAEAGVGTRTLR